MNILRFTKDSILRAITEIKKLLKESNNIEDLRLVTNDISYQITKDKSKVNDDIYKIPKYCIPRHAYLLNQKKLTTLWGC